MGQMVKTVKELPDHAKLALEEVVKVLDKMDRKEVEEIFLYNYNLAQGQFGGTECCGGGCHG